LFYKYERIIISISFKEWALLLEKFTSAGWGAKEHARDYAEVAMYGPGSELV